MEEHCKIFGQFFKLMELIEKSSSAGWNLGLFEPDKEPSSTRLDTDTKENEEPDVEEVNTEGTEVQEEA